MSLLEKIKKFFKFGEKSEDEILLDEKSLKITIYKTLKNIEENLRRIENKIDFVVIAKEDQIINGMLKKEDIELLKKEVELIVKNLKIENIERIRLEEIERFIQNAKIDELLYILKLIEKRLPK